MSLDAPTYVAALRHEGARTLDIARGHLDAAVPGCPGWAVSDVLGHLGRVHRSVAAHVRERATEMIPADRVPRPPGGEAILDFFAEGLDEVVAALEGATPDEPAWSWSNDHTAGFYHRRMANETAVHRWDVESASTAGPGPIDAELASDGIDELLTVVLPFAIRRWERPAPAGSIHLHRTDGEGEWLAAIDDGELVVRREHAKGDVAVRGGASDLVLALWERIPIEDPRFEVFGDVELARAWMALSR